MAICFPVRWPIKETEMSCKPGLKYSLGSYDNFPIKIKLRSFKSSEHINEKMGGPYLGFGYFYLISDPLDLATWSQR